MSLVVLLAADLISEDLISSKIAPSASAISSPSVLQVNVLGMDHPAVLGRAKGANAVVCAVSEVDLLCLLVRTANLVTT